MTKRVLVADKIAAEGIAWLQQRPGLAVEVKTGLDEAGLCAAVPGCAAVIVRSASRITAKVLDAADALAVVGRAGIGVDNIDVARATERGVVVLNTPNANATTTAELTIAHLLSLSRNLPAADRSVRDGKWERNALTGVEVAGKTLGIVGFGTIGKLVAARARGLRMRLLVHDPFVTAEVVAEAGGESADLERLLAEADYVSLHCPVTPQTKGLMTAGRFAAMKAGARFINCARGSLVDEPALADALASGHLAGAAVDVFAAEPPVGSPLLAAPNIVFTPHLGASTEEAQLATGTEIVRQVAAFLETGEPIHAVNLPAVTAEQLVRLKPFGQLARALGRLLGALAGGPLERVTVTLAGAPDDVRPQPVATEALIGLLSGRFAAPVNAVNAPHLAQGQGIGVTASRTDDAGDYRTLVAVAGSGPGGEVAVAGTLFDERRPRLVAIGAFEIEAVLEGVLLVTNHEDRPGVVAGVGAALAAAGRNIARMHIGPVGDGGRAMAVIGLDQPADQATLAAIAAVPMVRDVTQVDLRGA
ncbi:MAG TPA: phosphoglycerate dehydrogenase [Candidatus Krumholzibacteria bacterium]|nr:phosphoglycerate dehydrogenase [Candidatus Krumholzibacteria bacterium]